MTIAEFENRMGALIETSKTGDKEIAHSQADDLLREALEVVGGQSWQRFLTLYDAVEKWFA
jgi:hypothetical protein